MGLITKINDDADRMQPDDKIISGGLAFVADQFGNLHLQDPKPHTQKEQPPPVYAFIVGLEGAMEAGPIELSHHMNLDANEAFSKFSREYLLDIAFEI